MYNNYRFDKRLINCVPTTRQREHQKMEFYGFIHFGVNTFTDSEWGDGTENEKIFDPKKLDTDQWVAAAKAAGMTGLIITAKHHDGFCLWPSAYTEHSVKNSPFRDGKGDVVRELAESCRKGGIKMGVYLSPWDRNSMLYGQGKPYDDFFCNQLTELLTNYGELFCVWFDGACGEGPNGKKQDYDWQRYYSLIRKLQPDACISICGPDVRWCGNEAGRTRTSEWSVIPAEYDTEDAVAENSQHDALKPVIQLDCSAEDIGSRAILEDVPKLAWKHAEVDTSIRPGWFFHRHDNAKVRSVKELTDIYFRSVGGNCTLLLNLPPDTDGLLNDIDVERLEKLGANLKEYFAVNLMADASVSADKDDGIHTADNVINDDGETFYKTEDGENTAVIIVELPASRKVRILEIKEDIRFSQRIESFTVECQHGKTWKELYKGTTIGYKKLVRFRPVTTNAIRITINDSRISPVISHIALY